MTTLQKIKVRIRFSLHSIDTHGSTQEIEDEMASGAAYQLIYI